MFAGVSYDTIRFRIGLDDASGNVCLFDVNLHCIHPPWSCLVGLLDFLVSSHPFFFNFNTFCKLILNLTLFFFFKTNTFGRACCHGVAKRLCRAMHGGAAGG